jgi:hypothetical protein
MADGSAFSLTAAGQVARAADRAAVFVAAGMGVQTVIINLALDLDTGHVRVALIAVLTGAHGVMVDHTTECVLSTCARVLADLVDTGVSFATLIICSTSSHNWRQGSAAAVVICDITIGTGTHHGSNRQRVYDRTGSWS